MDAFELAAAVASVDGAGQPFVELARSHDLSVGVYVLDAGAIDEQTPHTEDEVYYVVEGRAMITVGDEQRPVKAGSIVFVAADMAHRFHDIEERLVVLVAFGPAEYTHRLDHERGHPHALPLGQPID